MKKLGNLGKLSQFSGIKETPTREQIEGENTELKEGAETQNNDHHGVNSQGNSQGKKVIDTSTSERVNETPVTKKNATRKTIKSIKDKPVTINIKISKSQKDWLADTASIVRDNNSEPVPPSERVYPQHLIGVAIAFLQSADVDWSQVKNEEELRELLNL